MIYFNFSFNYRDFSFQMRGDIKIGELVGLSGPSGAGKSTLLRLLAGLEKAKQGQLIVGDTVWFDSQKKIFLPPQMRQIGIVFQDYALFPHMTVKEQIVYAADQQDSKWIDELIALTGLDKLIHRYPYELSGGQKQRTALARALAKKPKLLLLDEPLSAVDHDTRMQLQVLLRHIHKEYLTYTLLVSHNIAELLFLSHRIFKCEKGEIIASGIPSQVLLSNITQHLLAQILEKRYINHDWILTLLIGQAIFNIKASQEEAAGLTEGETIKLSPKTLSALIA